MDNYSILATLGNGAFGTVYKAQNMENGGIVAIKRLKNKVRTMEECLAIQEIAALRQLNHPNIISLKVIIKDTDDVNLVLEFFDVNLYEFYCGYKERREYIPESLIRRLMYQAFQGLAYIHQRGFFHRDIKPENLLVRGGDLKIIDFGLVKDPNARPPFTDYISTRWYRAPELLLKSCYYEKSIDIYAMGCLIIELYNLEPLFTGRNQIEQLDQILYVLGTPNEQQWPFGYQQAKQMGITFPIYKGQSLAQIIPRACPEAIQFIYQMLSFNPAQRPTAWECLSSPYFLNYTSDSKLDDLILRNIRLNNTLNYQSSQGSGPPSVKKQFLKETTPEINTQRTKFAVSKASINGKPVKEQIYDGKKWPDAASYDKQTQGVPNNWQMQTLQNDRQMQPMLNDWKEPQKGQINAMASYNYEDKPIYPQQWGLTQNNWSTIQPATRFILPQNPGVQTKNPAVTQSMLISQKPKPLPNALVTQPQEKKAQKQKWYNICTKKIDEDLLYEAVIPVSPRQPLSPSTGFQAQALYAGTKPQSFLPGYEAGGQIMEKRYISDQYAVPH